MELLFGKMDVNEMTLKVDIVRSQPIFIFFTFRNWFIGFMLILLLFFEIRRLSMWL